MIWGQISSIIGIIVLAFLAFRHPFKPRIKDLIQVALLTSLSFVLALFSWMVPIMGFPALKIGLSQLPLMLVGYLYGPAWAFMAGFGSDVIELMSGTIATPFFGFTLNKVLVAMIPAFIVSRKSFASMRLEMGLVGILAVASLGYILSQSSITLNNVVTPLKWIDKSFVSAGVIVMTSLLMFGLFKIEKSPRANQHRAWLVSVMVVEFVVQLTLTPLWLYSMYGLPIVISIMVRVLKSLVMIPVNGFLGISSLSLLKRIKA